MELFYTIIGKLGHVWGLLNSESTMKIVERQSIEQRLFCTEEGIISGPLIAISSLSHVAKNILTHHLDHQGSYLKQHLTHCLHDSVLEKCSQFSIFHAEHYRAVIHNP